MFYESSLFVSSLHVIVPMDSYMFQCYRRVLSFLEEAVHDAIMKEYVRIVKGEAIEATKDKMKSKKDAASPTLALEDAQKKNDGK